MTERRVRDATPADAAACAAIYAPYVRDTAVTFETEVPSAQVLAERIATAQQAHAWLVLEEDGVVTGYAYGGPFKTRAAYAWSCEVSVYLDADLRGGGRGRQLYTALLERLRQRGLRRAFGVITSPNEPSFGLHRAFGFEQVALLPRVGWKAGRWHDVAYVQADLAGSDDPPQPLH